MRAPSALMATPWGPPWRALLALKEARRDRPQVLLAALVGVQDGSLEQARAVELPDLHADARHALAARRRGVAVPGVGRDQAADGRRRGGAEGRDDEVPRRGVGGRNLAHEAAIGVELDEAAGRTQDLARLAAIAQRIGAGAEHVSVGERDVVVRGAEAAARPRLVDVDGTGRQRLAA